VPPRLPVEAAELGKVAGEPDDRCFFALVAMRRAKDDFRKSFVGNRGRF